MSDRLLNKVALVTGAGGAIGRTIAIMMANEGAKVAIADIDINAANETLEIIKNNNGEAIANSVDVSDEKQVQEWIAAVHKKYQSIDILVNNAAAFVFGKVTDVSSEQWDRVLNVNVKGYAFTIKHCIPYMEKNQNGASIINIASISAFIAQDAFVPYNTSKGAILQLTRCVAKDHGKHNIRCNAICPGFIDTPATEKHAKSLGTTKDKLIEEALPQHFTNRVGCTEDVAYAVVYLASKESTFVTGSTLMVDGGITAQ